MLIHPETSTEERDPTLPTEIENPGDPGPPVLVPPEGTPDQRENEKLPAQPMPPPGV
jgi:hypothetical protein